MKKMDTHIALVGMSNVGKSYWAQLLESEQGYQRISLDEEIAKRLELSSVNDLVSWLGTPEIDGYFARQTEYLYHEEHALMEVLQNISQYKKLVIDTTGSLVHLSAQTIRDLQKQMSVVFLENSNSDATAQLMEFTRQPKPIVWGQYYHGNLELDFKKLLDFRIKQYRTIAEIIVDVSLCNDLDDFTEQIVGYQVWPYEEYLKRHILPDLEKGRPDWDRPHTEMVVQYVKQICDHNPKMNLDRHALIVAAYLHDWGYSTLYRGTKALYDSKTMKQLHAKRSAKKWVEISKQNDFRLFKPEQITRIEHLITVHDELEQLQDIDELILMEADTLGALATPSNGDSDFVGKSYASYLKRTKKRRFNNFITEFSRKEFKKILKYHKRKLGWKGWFL